MLPLVYCLMSDKRRESYEAIFSQLKLKATQLGSTLHRNCPTSKAVSLQQFVRLSRLHDTEVASFISPRPSIARCMHFNCCRRTPRKTTSACRYASSWRWRFYRLRLYESRSTPWSCRRVSQVLVPLFAYFRHQWWLTAIPTSL